MPAPLRALARCCRGSVAVEAAFAAPVVIMLAIGAAEYGRAYAVRLRLEASARDGLQAAVDQIGADASLTQVQSAVQALVGQGATVAVTRACACQGAASACDTLCGGTSLPEMRLQVSAQQSLAPMTFYPGQDGPLTLSAVALLRVREVAAGAGRPRGPAALARDAAGAVAVEFALTAPMLILLGLGAVEFGRATLAYHEVVAASAAGARYAMVHGSGSGSPADAAAVATAAKAGLVTVSAASVTVGASWTPGKAPGDTATVTVSYPFRFVISGLSPITLSSTMTVTISN